MAISRGGRPRRRCNRRGYQSHRVAMSCPGSLSHHRSFDGAQSSGSQSDSLPGIRRGPEKMRSALITACMLVLGAYAPGVSLGQQLHHAPAQAHAAPPQRQAQTERERQGTPRPDIRRGNTSVAAESAVARRWAEPHRSSRSSGGPASDAPPPQPGNRQMSAAMAMLLGLALLSHERRAQ